MVENVKDDLGWLERPESTQKLMRIEQLMNSLIREFKKLLKENNNLKDTIATNLPRYDSSSPVKANGSSDSPQVALELDLKTKRVSDDIPMQENNNFPDKISADDPQTPNKIKKILAEHESIAEFNYNSDQSWLEQSSRSKPASINSKHQLQNSPVIGNQKRIKLKKSQSPKVDLTPQIVSPSSAKENSKKRKRELNTESQKFVSEDVKSLDTTKSLFNSRKEKQDETFVSPQPKPRSKLGITKLYNTKLLNDGGKYKQTKLVFTAEEERTDISSANFSHQVTNDTCDSIFDISLISKDVDDENMDIEMDDIVENSPSPLNSCIRRSNKQNLKKQDPVSKKSQKISKSTKSDKGVPSKVLTLKTDETFFVPQACSTQISLSKKEGMCDMRTIQDLFSDYDTNFSFNEKLTSKKQSTEQEKKNLFADVLNTSSPQKQKFDTRKDVQSQESHYAPVTETALEDETFFSPGEHENVAGCQEIPKPTTSVQKNATSLKAKRVLINSFDQVPESKKQSPEYAYAAKSIKRKCERMELNGWSCWSCKEYYENIKLPEEDLQKMMKHCSRHKAKHDPEYHTPPGFWNPVFSDTIAPSFPRLQN